MTNSDLTIIDDIEVHTFHNPFIVRPDPRYSDTVNQLFIPGIKFSPGYNPTNWTNLKRLPIAVMIICSNWNSFKSMPAL